MANLIGNAIGTQRQFAKQPEGVYGKRLQGVSVGAGLGLRDTSGAMNLANSLGLLGGAILEAQVAKDARREKLGNAEADRIFALTSEEDKQKLSTLDILARSEKFDLADNPYAAARIDELRGQHLNTLYKNEYDQSVAPNQPLAKDSQENAKTFEDYMNSRLKEDGITFTNSTAFNKGFFSSRPIDLLEQDAKYRKRRQNDLEEKRNAALSSKADDIITNSYGRADADVARDLQKLQEDEMLTGVSLNVHLKLSEGILKSLALNGSPSQITAYGETVLYFDDTTGQEVRVKDLNPMGYYNVLANRANSAMFEQKTREFLKGAESLTSSEIPDYFEKLQKSDPTFYKAIAPRLEGMVKAAQIREEKERKAYQKAQEDAYKSRAATNALEDKFQAFNSGKTLDINGRLSTTNIYECNGKQYNFTEREVIDWSQQKFYDNIKTLGAVEGSKANLQLLSFPPVAEKFTKAITKQMDRGLALLNVNSLEVDEEGNKILPQELDNIVTMYKVDPGLFSATFGTESKDILILSQLIDANGLEEGVAKYAERRDTFNGDITLKEKHQKRLKDAYETVMTIPELNTLGGYGETGTANLTTNYSLNSMFHTTLDGFLLSGMDETKAISLAKQQVASAFFNYDGVAIPKNFIMNIQSSNQETVALAYLENKKKELAVDGDEENVHYYHANGVLKAEYHGKTVYSQQLAGFTEDVSKYLQSLPEAQRVRLEDVYNIPLDDSEYYEADPTAKIIRDAGLDANRYLND